MECFLQCDDPSHRHFNSSSDKPATQLDYGECSPMVTHYHVLPGTNCSNMNGGDSPLRRIRSRSLGSRNDTDVLLLPPIESFKSIASLEENQHENTTTTMYNSNTGIQTPASPRSPKKLNEEPSEEHRLVNGEQHTNNNNSNTPSPSKIQQSQTSTPTPIYISFLYGLINACIVLPVLMSFGSIIYRDPAFAPYMPVLIKLTVVSGMIHQICFSLFSSLPFAVGQVQDAGLIFLSSMAQSMVQYCQQQQQSSGQPQDDERMLATVTVGLSLATVLLGIGLLIIGYFRLAGYVQLLPTAVIGGYLAFIGYFCGVSGVALMAQGDDNNNDKHSHHSNMSNVQYWLPGLLGGLAIYILVRRIRHMAVLPTSIMVLLAIFYLVLWRTDTSIAEATDLGWIRASDPPPPWYQTWDYLKFDKVDWSAYPSQLWTLVCMISVVALSSSLDVAAIELELQTPLNYNSELKMVGISNLVSGLTGGYTGSYIFSQSIFSLRAGIRSRWSGLFLALMEGLVLVAPIPILSYIPNFFFGSLLIMICADLMYEWLWEVRRKLTQMEYAICWATFLLIQWTGVEGGIILGTMLYVLCTKMGWLPASIPKEEEFMDEDDSESLMEDASVPDGGGTAAYGTMAIVR